MVCTHGHDHKDANCIDEQATSKQVATLITNEVFQTQDDVSDSNQVQNTDTPEDQVTTALEQVLGFINQRISVSELPPSTTAFCIVVSSYIKSVFHSNSSSL